MTSYSKNFSYDIALKKQGKKVWKNPKAKAELLRVLSRFDDENADLQEKSIKGIKSKNVTELKNSGTGPRIFIYREKNQPPKVIGFCMRDDLKKAVVELKKKY